MRVFSGAAAPTFSDPLTASLVPLRRSQPPFAVAGATRSRRFDKSDRGRGDGLASRLDWPPEPSGELWVGVNLSGCSPLSDQLAQGLVVVERSRSDDNP